MPLPEDLKADGNATPISVERKREEILVTLEKLLTDPAIAERILQLQKLKRPPNVSKVATYSYYRESFALEIKFVLDEMMADPSKSDWEYKYSDFPELKKSSLKMRVWQSLKFLLDHLDPDLKYNKFREKFTITPTKTGVSLAYIRDRLAGRRFVPTKITPEVKAVQWKIQIEEFLRDGSSEMLRLENLNLTKEEAEELNTSLNLVDGIMAVIGTKEIIIRKDPDVFGPFTPVTPDDNRETT